MGSRSSPRVVSRSASYHYRLSDGIHKVPSAVTLWPCEMTDLSPTGFLQHNQSHPHHHQQAHSNISSSSAHQSSSHSSGVGGGRLFSYFGNDHERERKKSETSFFNLGFRRKSTVVYYAATD